MEGSQAGQSEEAVLTAATLVEGSQAGQSEEAELVVLNSAVSQRSLKREDSCWSKVGVSCSSSLESRRRSQGHAFQEQC